MLYSSLIEPNYLMKKGSKIIKQMFFFIIKLVGKVVRLTLAEERVG